MEFIVEKIGMSRTISVPSTPVTLLRVLETKVCEIREDKSALVAYSSGKKMNKAVAGQQKKFGLSAEYNRFMTLEKVVNTEVGDLDLALLNDAKSLQLSFVSKGRGFTGVIKRHGFQGGLASHGSRFHRHGGSIGNCEWPGRVMKGRKMPGQHGNSMVSVKSDFISYDAQSGVLVVKGSVSGPNGALGRARIAK